MVRLPSILTLVTASLLASPASLTAADQSAAKPNIILIMADDLGYAALGSYGQRLILTPEIDKMAADGIRFTDFYAGNTVCVTMIARWPGHIQPAQTSRIPAAGWDFMATFAELAGVARPAHTDGISLDPTLLGQRERQPAREYLYWEYHMRKQQAVRLGSWKGVRFGGTKEPIELCDLDADIGENHNVSGDHPDIVTKIPAIMEEARANSEFNRFWPLPGHRQNQIKMDKMIFDQLEHGIR